jgi:hypothetical protein
MDHCSDEALKLIKPKIVIHTLRALTSLQRLSVIEHLGVEH